jgi:hypothetical protein
MRDRHQSLACLIPFHGYARGIVVLDTHIDANEKPLAGRYAQAMGMIDASTFLA